MLSAMLASVRDCWRRAQGYQRLCYIVGILLMGIGLLHLAGFLALGGPWVGPLAWRKPFAFGLPFGITTLTLGWLATYLPMARRTSWLLFAMLATANTIEVLWVTTQRARGVSSHFNVNTPLDASLFRLGGP